VSFLFSFLLISQVKVSKNIRKLAMSNHGFILAQFISLSTGFLPKIEIKYF